MRRGPTGRHEVTRLAGDEVRAFIPAPLPPDPSLNPQEPWHQRLDPALLSLGRLAQLSSAIPDPSLFLYSYVRKEAVLSSQIEGTQSSLSDLLLYEIDETPGVPLDDAAEVSRYVAALEHGLARMRDGFPFSNRLIREIHGVLLADGRGSTKDPGEFRRSQNWIGGTRPGNAAFVPPPHTAVPDCMASLEQFLHSTNDGVSALVRAGLAHVQFETIHPFLDGNGRVGRLLITLYLCQAGLLREPLLYLSLHLRQHRQTYYDLLTAVRETGDWESWLAFFLEGVQETANGAVATAQRLISLFEADRQQLAGTARRAPTLLRIHEALKARPLTTVKDICIRSGLAFPTVSAAMKALTEHSMVRELTGRRRNRVFAYDRYLSILNEGTQVPSN